MNKTQAALLLLVGAAAGVGGKTAFTTSAEAALRERVALSSQLIKREQNDGGTQFYVRTTTMDYFTDGGRALGPQVAGVVTDPAQVTACATYWRAVVAPGKAGEK